MPDEWLLGSAALRVCGRGGELLKVGLEHGALSDRRAGLHPNLKSSACISEFTTGLIGVAFIGVVVSESIRRN